MLSKVVSYMLGNVQTQIACSVLPEHIDVLGHLNNAHYPQYFELGRIAMQERLGIPDQQLVEHGLGLVVRSARYTYLQPAYKGQELSIVTTILPYAQHERAPRIPLFALSVGNVRLMRGPRLTGSSRGMKIRMKHEIYGTNGLIATAQTAHVFVNLATGKPIRPLEEVVRQIS